MSKTAPSLASAEKRPFYGWVIVAALFLIVFTLFGAYYSFGVFLKPLEAEFGWTRTLTSGVITMSMLLSGVCAIAMGGLADKYGPRKIIIFGGVLAGLGYVLMAAASSLWQLYAWLGFLVGIGMSISFAVPAATISRWFSLKRGLGLGITFSSVGLAQMVVPPLVARLIEISSWRLAYALLGIAAWVVIIVAATLVRRAPEEMGLVPDGKCNAPVPAGGNPAVGLTLRQVFGTSAFWLWLVVWFLFGLPCLMVVIHVVPYASDFNIEPVVAASIVSVAGASAIVGRIAFGSLADRIGNKATVLICLGLLLISLLLFARASDLRAFYVAALIYGGSYSGADNIQLNIAGEFFGRRALGVIFGFSGLAWRSGAASGALLAGGVYDVTRSYPLAFLMAAVVVAVSIALIFVLFARTPKLEK